MTTRRGEICFYGLRLITAIGLLWVPRTIAQDDPKRIQSQHEQGWSAAVVSGLFPATKTDKVKARIEQDQLVCRSTGSSVLEIPLKSISRVCRDTTKDYPIAQFLMTAAVQPSTNPPTFGSREFREQMAARATLGALAFVGLLFPRHKDEIYLSWTDEDGEHGAVFLMGRKDGCAMLKRLKQETGIEVRNLEKERKDYENGMRELRRQVKREEKRKESKEAVDTPAHHP